MSLSRRAKAGALGSLLLASVALAPATAVAHAPTIVSQESPAAGTPTDLSLWVFVDDHARFLEDQAALWNAANPDRPITISATVIPYEDMHNQLLAAFVAGSGAPDLVDIEIGKFSTFVKTEDDVHLLDLTAEVAPYLPDLVATRMAPYQAYGKQLGLDYHLGSYLMYYNRVLLEQAGIDADAIKTWDDYIAAGKTFQAKFPDKSWTAVGGQEYFTASGLMGLNGGGLYNSSGQLIVNSPENIEALQLLTDMVNVHHIAIQTPGGNVHSADFYAALTNQQVASIWMPQWYMIRPPWQDAQAPLCGSMIVRRMPMFKPDGFTTTTGGGTGTAVTDQTPAAEQQVAKDFLAFAKLTKDAQKALYTDLGFDPYRMDVYDDPSLSVPNPCFSGEDTFSIIKSGLGNVAPEYVGPMSPEARTYISTTTLDEIVNGGKPVADALAEAQSQVEAMQ